MPYLPQLEVGNATKDTIDSFYGYNHRAKIGPGEMFDTKNLTTAHFPMLATRNRRGEVQKLTKPQGLLAKDKLAYVDNGTLYYGGEQTPVTGLSDGPKQLVSMGAYICIFPDKRYFNTVDENDYGGMDVAREITGYVTYTPCAITGVDYTDITSRSTPPENPVNGKYWYDTISGSLKRYSEAQSSWVTIETVYCKIEFQDLPYNLDEIFKEYDGVTISGTAHADALDGDKVIYGVGTNFIIVIGMIDLPEDPTGSPEGEEQEEEEEEEPDEPEITTISLSRTVPDLDFVVECQNRLWGCYYGKNKDGKTINELYCSALGDFKNWRVYMGLSTDSWAASVGSDGPWTGAINYLGYPTFFKETAVHRVSVSATGAHQVIEQALRGVQQGSSRSLAIVNETLIYKSRTDVCAYQGGFPEGISEALGDVRYSEAVAGVFGGRYYISMKDEYGAWNLFVYDSNTRLWIREDDLHVSDIVAVDDSLYALDTDGTLWDLNGALGEKESTLPWIAQTGIQYYEYPNRKYVSRFYIVIGAQQGTKLDLYIQYDSDGVWRHCGHTYFKGVYSVTFPVRPRRCNHMEVRVVGDGEAKIYSISRVLEQGSDI